MNMSKKIVLVIPNSIWMNKDHLPSIGIGYLAACLEKEKYEVMILDCEAESLNEIEAAEWIERVKPDAVGVTATSHNRFWSISLIREIKKRIDVLIFAGGIHFSLTAKDAMKNISELDAVVKGEGEITTVEFLNTFFSGRDLAHIEGIVFRSNNGAILETPDRQFQSNLNALPDPAWHLFNMDKYNAMLEGCKSGDKTIGVMSSRGCPFNCIFCSNKAFWKQKLRFLEPGKFVNQLVKLNKEYGYYNFDFWDDTFTANKKHVYDICTRLLETDFSMNIYFRSRVETVDKNLLTMLKNVGGFAIGYGIESGSQRILDNISKNIKVEQAINTVKQSIDMGFLVKTFFMTSLPGETIEDIEKTYTMVDMLKKYGKDRIRISYGIPTMIYPGTDVEELAKSNGSLDRDFSWNSECHFSKAEKYGLNPIIPYFENETFTLDDIMEYKKNRQLGKLKKIIKYLSSLISSRHK